MQPGVLSITNLNHYSNTMTAYSQIPDHTPGHNYIPCSPVWGDYPGNFWWCGNCFTLFAAFPVWIRNTRGYWLFAAGGVLDGCVDAPDWFAWQGSGPFYPWLRL